jgi:carbon monoxide dehydrogenase subunit G
LAVGEIAFRINAGLLDKEWRRLMGEVKVTEQIDATAAAVWDVLRNFGGIKRYRPALESCELEGSGIGAVRTLVFPGGNVVKERLERHDDAARVFGYSILDGSGPMKDGQVTVEVRAEGEACVVRWHALFVPDGVPEEKLTQMLDALYRDGIQGIRDLLSGANA